MRSTARLILIASLASETWHHLLECKHLRLKEKAMIWYESEFCCSLWPDGTVPTICCVWEELHVRSLVQKNVWKISQESIISKHDYKKLGWPPFETPKKSYVFTKKQKSTHKCNKLILQIVWKAKKTQQILDIWNRTENAGNIQAVRQRLSRWEQS